MLTQDKMREYAMRIKTKMLLTMIVSVLLVTAAVLVTVISIFSTYMDETIEKSLETATSVVSSEYSRLAEKAMVSAKLAAESKDLADTIAANDRMAMIDTVEQIRTYVDVEFFTVMDPEGNVLLRAHEPDNYGDSLANQMNVQTAMLGEQFTTVEEGSAVKLSIRSGCPVYKDGELIGVISVGYRLDTFDFVDKMKVMTDSEITVFLGDIRLSTTIINTDGNRLVGTAASAEVYAQVTSGKDYSGKIMLLGQEAFVHYSPLRDHTGRILGMLFIGKYTNVKDAPMQRFIMNGGIVALGLLFLASIVIFIISGRVARPIMNMVRVTDSLSKGEVDVSIKVKTHDETRKLADALERMIHGVNSQAETIRAIAEGDFSVRVELRSEKDVVGMALQQMLDKNNTVFSRMTTASRQVATFSRQIASSAQMLAQGSTEQASAIDELSSSISTIAVRAGENADIAAQTAQLGESIRTNAEMGSEQMQQLTKAVTAINEASQSISEVIKVIDSIAFQTNILALNAAVEAARAGQHGKGFAVVADEVRNLAAKSAEAAKDTSVMISDSIKKAELGVQIAGKTAQSFADIVAGINKSGSMVADIATSSGEASAAIAQINIGIDQVAQIVQQNTANSEESAAASEEMNEQSEQLNSLVSQFRLANLPGDPDHIPALPPSKFEFGKTRYAFQPDLGKY